jgi:hypothetical protein
MVLMPLILLLQIQQAVIMSPQELRRKGQTKLEAFYYHANACGRKDRVDYPTTDLQAALSREIILKETFRQLAEEVPS